MKSSPLHILVATVVCIAAIAGYGAWYAAVEAKSVAVARLESQVAAKTATVNRAASSRASLAEIADDEATIRSYFVPETGVVAFIDSLQARGEEQKARVNVLSVSPVGATAATPSLMLSLSITGTFAQVMSTVGAIEYAPYDLTVSSLSITKSGKDGWHATLNIVVGSVSATQTASSTVKKSPAVRASSPPRYAYF